MSITLIQTIDDDDGDLSLQLTMSQVNLLNQRD